MSVLNRNKELYLLFVLAAALLVLPGCPKKAETVMAPEAQREEAPAPAEQAMPDRKAEEERRAAEAEEEARERAAAGAEGLRPIHFDFDSSVIREDARETMKANADWLKAHPQARVRIEGNCDERGTIEYNQALGQRRAQTAKKYLSDLGISASRIALISYGKEKPVCTESTEECWQKNRRDDFVAVEK
jgi:peptidoglycan-associated lipoprotein